MKKILKYLQQTFDITRSKKIIDSLFVGYVVIVIIPVLVLGMLFTSIFTYHFSSQTKSNVQYSMQYTAKILNGHLDAVYNASYSFMCNDDILDFGKYKNYSFEQAMAISKVEPALVRARVQNDVIDDVYLYYNSSGNILSASQGMYNEKSLFGMKQNDLYDFLVANSGRIVALDAVSESGLEQNHILYIKSVDKKRTAGDIYAVFVLNDKLIREAMHIVNANGDGCVLLIDDEFDCLVADGDARIQYTDEVRDAIKDITAGGKGKYIKTSIGRKKIYMLVESISLTKLNMCFMISASHHISKLWIIWIFILIVSLFIMAVGIFVARIYSRRVYRPIGNIIDLFRPEQNEYGEKSEFAFFEEKFVEIQTMQNRLAEYDDDHIRNARQLLVYNYLKGYVGDAESFKKTASDFDICFDGEGYSIVLIKVDRMAEIARKIQMYHYQRFVMENVVQCLAEQCRLDMEQMYEFYDGEYIGLIICHSDAYDLEECMRTVQKALKNKLEITLTVCISDKIPQSELLHATYKNLCSIMNQIRLCGCEFLITAPQYDGYNKDLDLNRFEKSLRTFIKEQRTDEIEALIDETFASGKIFYTGIMQVYTCIIKVLIDVANEDNCFAGIFVDENLQSIDKLNDFNSAVDVAQYLKSTCVEASNVIDKTIRNRNKNYDRIMEYISNNYIYDIDLQNMAEEFGFSKSYFSRYLKEVTGKNYVELLNGYRIEKAKELINTNSSLKLFQVAELVGFASYRTFSSTFRKFEGKSPETYRSDVN